MAIAVGLGLSKEKDTLKAAQEAAKQAQANIRTEKIDLAIVFSSLEFAHLSVLKSLYNLLGPAAIIGCSSPAIITAQGILKHGLAILLLSIPEGIYFNTACVKEISAKSATDAGRELGDKLLYGFKGLRRDLSTIFSNSSIPDSSPLISGLQEKLGKSFPLAGASVSDNLTFKKAYLYSQGEILADAACGILWGGKLNFGLGVKHGYKPLGKPHSVTSATGNIVETIDAQPAAGLYADYLGCDFAKLKKDIKHISMLYPLGVYIPGEEEYLLRNVVSVEENGFLHLQGNIAAGAQVKLMIGTKESCLEATRKAAEEAKNGLSGHRADFILAFNSISRYLLLKRRVSEELEMLQGEFGQDTPVIGIYTYGEQAPLKAINYQGKTYFHNQSVIILAIGG